jgi:hypothetical protein
MSESVHELPPEIPDDPQFPDRPSHAFKILAAVAKNDGDFKKLQTAQSALLAPLNHRFFLPILENLARLYETYPNAFSSLNGIHAAALRQTLDSYDLLGEISDVALLDELRSTPRHSVTGNLRYSTGRHPLYSLLMLEHPHPTGGYFDVMVAATVCKAISLREHFDWEAYRQYVHPETRLTALCPQPLNSVIARVEFLARSLTSDTHRDPLSKLAARKVPLEISAILDFLCKESMLNSHSKSAVRLAEKVDSFLHATSSREGGRRGSSYGIREGINLGTLIAGPLEASAAELPGAMYVSCTTSDARQEAADLDMVPEELSSSAPTLLLDLGIGAGLPASARTALSRHMAAQIARVQQLMPTRDSGLRPHRLQPVGAMMSCSSISPSVALLLRASLACGRPISILERMAITVGASADDADETIEFDIVRGTWRIKVNTPALRMRQPPAGARPTCSHAELPDVVGAVPLARAYHSGKGSYAERIALRWTAAEHEQAAALLKSIRLDADFLGRLLPMALYQATGDLATGALIGKWLPNGSTTYLHYLTVERRRIAEQYWRAATSLRPALMLPMSDAMPPIEIGCVGMHNCPSDQLMRTLVTEMISELQSQRTATTGDRAAYINLLYT